MLNNFLKFFKIYLKLSWPHYLRKFSKRILLAFSSIKFSQAIWSSFDCDFLFFYYYNMFFFWFSSKFPAFACFKGVSFPLHETFSVHFLTLRIARSFRTNLIDYHELLLLFSLSLFFFFCFFFGGHILSPKISSNFRTAVEDFVQLLLLLLLLYLYTFFCISLCCAVAAFQCCKSKKKMCCNQRLMKCAKSSTASSASRTS